MPAILSPSAPARAGTNNPRPTWIRLPTGGLCLHTGLCRGKIYELIKTGAIRSAAVRSPGRKEGTRVVHLASLLAYIESQATGPATPNAAVAGLPE